MKKSQVSQELFLINSQMGINEEIGKRIGDFIDSRFSTRREAAQEMGMDETNLSALISGKAPFGPKNKKRFEKIKGNVTYAITGIYPNADDQKKSIERETEETKILNNLKLLGLDTWEKVNEILAPTLRVAEKMEEYKTKKK